ncbi:MAG TPA: AmmeMemoRadiSam system radical SAM enzyme [Syntrophaceticus sp.]|nr:AmmeMemoRadiSam system radical SAM enzyme [Syntrophaceticus sp.]
MQEARYYEKMDDQLVWCHLCPQNCKIKPGRKGICRARQNHDGVLYTLNYGKLTSWGIDPIEKKPLHRFCPGSLIFSVGTFGCNFRCGFCQNWEIAHGDLPTREVTAEELVKIALDARRAGSIGIAYTYSEPMIWYEFVYDTAKRARQEGLKNVLVTNGFVQKEPLMELLPYIDAMNIDVKAFTEEFYRKTCGGQLDPVLRTVELAHKTCHVEITTLVVPGMNDSEEEISSLVDWIASLDPSIPLHLSRYFPRYKFDLPPTPIATLKRAKEIALEKLKYVYLGNV